MNKIYTEARCKIIWGDAPDSVKEYLMKSNISNEQADGIIQALLDERYAAVKRNGKIKAIKGIAATILCGGFLFLIFSNLDSISTHSTRKGGGLALPALGLMWGLWKGTDGIIETLHPSKFKGDVGINTD
jgi:hypothetical protein